MKDHAAMSFENAKKHDEARKSRRGKRKIK